MSDKPREFWIYKNELGNQIHEKYLPDGAYIHVIEYSALEKANAKIAELEAKLSKAVEERDAYAKAMAVALEHGIFANKQDVKREIEKLLAETSKEGEA